MVSPDSRWFCRTLVITIMLPLLGTVAQPKTIAQVTSANDNTGTVVNSRGDRFTIRGGQRSRDGENLFHSFEDFGLSRDQIANFRSEADVRNILGRIIGGDASFIDGLIRVTGSEANLYLMNPAGIVFGTNAQLDVPAAFTATTADSIGFGNGWFSAAEAGDYRALVGEPTAFIFSANQPGSVLNAGHLQVSEGHRLGLLGGTVVNTGQLSAPGGEIVLAAVPGENLVRLSQAGSLLSLEIQPLTASGSRPEDWSLPIATLPELLTGGTSPAATGVRVRSNGAVELVNTDFQVPSGAGMTVVSGEVDAATTRSGQRGGTVAIVGDRIALSGATVEASGRAGGGTVLIGGDRQGQGTLPTAARTYISRDSTLRADATNAGNGGQVIVWSDQATGFFGDISAQGGSQSGNGGFVEVSGRRFLSFDGTVNLLANQGSVGTFLLDPLDIIIQPGEGDGNDADADPDSFLGSPSGNPGEVLAGDTAPTILFESELENIFGDIILEARRNITIEPLSDGILELSGGGSITFTADADNNGVGDFSMAPTDLILTNGRDLTISGVNIRTGAIATLGVEGPSGDVTLTAQETLRTGGIDVSAPFSFGVFPGDVTLTSRNGDVNVAFINASTFNFEGAVGTVRIRGDRVRIRSTVNSESSISIDTRSFGESDGAGAVIIRHAGGPDNEPFVVGGSTANGTAGSIEASFGDALTTGSFPVLPAGGLAAGTPDSIQLISINRAPTLAANSTFATEQNQPITITFADLAIRVADENNDVTAVIIDTVSGAGTLTLNGEAVVPGETTLSPEDELVYTPPNNETGTVDVFTVRASDRVSVSNAAAVAVDIRRTPTDPTDPMEPTEPEPPETPTGPDLQIDPQPFEFNPPGSPSLPNSSSPPISIDYTISRLEEKFTQTFLSYLNLESTPLATLDEGKDIARQIEEATGAKPAFVYVDFVPDNVDLVQPNLAPQPSDQLELVVVTAQGETIRRRIGSARREQVMAMAQAFRSAVTDPRRINTESYLPSAQQLYQWMIAPIQADLEARGITNLVFIAETGLRSLPYAALHDGQQFLIEQYSIGLMPSLSLTDTRYVDIREAQMLAMGVSESTQGQTPLPAVPVEIMTLALELWQGRIFLNDNATLENLQEIRQVQPFGIIHMATHADFVPGPISNSYIQLWDDKLRLDQVRQLDWNNPAVEMLVLSACRTALGDAEAELGFAGLAVQTGVKSVVASLWYVSDVATAALMTQFYSALGTAPIKAEALRDAQLAMARGEVYVEDGQLKGLEVLDSLPLPPNVANINGELSHPYYWAAFTIVGNPW